MEHDLTFQKIKDQVELPALLHHFGYELKKEQQLGKGKFHVFEGDDKLVVFKGKGGDWMYFNVEGDQDKGTVIDWMKNRLVSGRIAGLSQQPDRTLWQSVNDEFRKYLNLPPEQRRPALELPSLAPTNPGERFASIYLQDCRPLTNTTYLESRGIAKNTWENEQFAGRILNHYHTVQKEGLPPITYTNTAFPGYYQDRVVALEIKSEHFKGQAPESEFARSLWLSKPPQQPGPLLVTESALDSLSYAQLRPQESAQYAATAGVLTQNKIQEMVRVVADNKLTGIKAAFDNDAQGHYYDTKLLAALATAQNPLQATRADKYTVLVKLASEDKAQLAGLGQRFKEFNEHTSASYYQTTGTSAPAAGHAAPATLQAALISVAKTPENTYEIRVPFTREALDTFNQAALHHLAYSQPLSLVKSQAKDWNEDLKQSQLQTVVQQELGPAQVPASQPALAEGQAWRQAAQEQAQAKNERLVIVEVSDYKQERLHSPAIQEKLEQAGLRLENSQNLPATQPQETKKGLLFHYDPTSPKLAAIDQALAQVREHPRATVSEPASQAAERSQEVARQQPPTVTLVPSPSPVHDQTRQEFIASSGPVAKALRAVNEGLAAAFLQQLSKILIQKPQIAGIDREQFEKVANAMDRHEPVKNLPEAQQLKQAIKVLEKPALTPSQQQQETNSPAKQAKRSEAKRGVRL